MRLLFGVKAIRTHLARTYSSSRFGKVSKQTGTKCAKIILQKEKTRTKVLKIEHIEFA